MAENLRNVSAIIRKLHDDMGGAILIDDVVQNASEESIPEEDVLEAIDTLERDGIIGRIDSETIEFM